MDDRRWGAIERRYSLEKIEQLKGCRPGQIIYYGEEADAVPDSVYVHIRIAELEKENAELRKKLQALTGGGFWD